LGLGAFLLEVRNLGVDAISLFLGGASKRFGCQEFFLASIKLFWYDLSKAFAAV
jgi:hypothetical protein